ncbi:hypothetical protein [Solibacillus isronensis]
MSQFFSDMIHLTEGEKFIKYWWLWILIVSLIFIVDAVMNKRGGKNG